MFATQLVFYGLPWLQWNGRQALLFDLAARKFYIFGLVLLAAGLHLPHRPAGRRARSRCSSSPPIAGRLWCGYACPQTVYTEIFLWVERAHRGRPQGAR